MPPSPFFFFLFTDTAPTEIYTLSLHDALPILGRKCGRCRAGPAFRPGAGPPRAACRTGHLFCPRDRKSTRLNSSHRTISYAVFCLKKKKTTKLVIDDQQ